MALESHGFAVELTVEAHEQLIELFLSKLEHSSVDAALVARDAIEAATDQIGRNPYICPIADNDPTERKLVIPFGRKTGYVALFSIEDDMRIYVTAIRHQLQDDFLR